MTFRLLLAIFLFCLPALSRAQAAWCPVGAEWQYGYGDMNESGIVTMRYAADTLVGGKTAQVLRRSATTTGYIIPGSPYPPIIGGTHTWRLPTIITRTNGDSVLFWHNGRYVPLYCFGAQPGQSWTTYGTYPTGVCAQYPVQVTVDSVGTQLLGGRLVRWQAVHVSSTGYISWGRRIYAGIGNVRSLQPGGGICGGTDPGFIGVLQSFKAPGYSVIGSGSGGLVVLATATAQAQRAGFEAYPTPTTGSLSVRVPAGLPAASSLSLHDLTGRLLRRQPVPANGQLDLRGLPAGVYLLSLEAPGQPLLSQRVVLQ